MTDQDKAKAIERANAYRDMMGTWAWKDFVNTANELKEDASLSIDNMTMDQSAFLYIAEARGIRKGIQKLLEGAQSVLEDIR